MSQNLFMCVRFKAKPERRDELQSRLLEMVEITVKEEGCLFYDLHVDRDDENIFYLFEGWESQGAHDIHEQTAHVQALVADVPGLTVDGLRLEFMHKISPTSH
jgi:quinol monooxygenase YgiN